MWNNGCQLGLRVVSPDIAHNSSHIGFVEGMNEGRHGYTCMLWRGMKRGPEGEKKEQGGKRRKKKEKGEGEKEERGRKKRRGW